MVRTNCRPGSRKKILISLFLFASFFDIAESAVTITKTDISKKADVKEEYLVNNGTRSFIVGYSCRSGENGEFKPIGEFSGLWIRSKEAPGNWYWKGDGFLALFLNGKNALTLSKPEFAIVSQGKKGIIDLKWNTELADVTVRMLFMEDADNIFFELQVNPKLEISSQKVKLFNMAPYNTNPASPKENVLEFKNIATPKRTLSPAMLLETLRLERDENWLFYYNTKIEKFGPSALLWLKNEVSLAQCVPKYFTILNFDSKIRKLHFVIWSFRQSQKWEDTLREFKESLAGNAENEIEKEDFQPLKKVMIKEE